VQPVTAADLREGVATTPAFIRIENGRVSFRRGVPAIALPVVRGTVEDAPQIAQTRVPVAMVLGDDMRTVFDPDSRNPIRIFDRNGRIVQEIPVPTTDPVTGEELRTVREIMIRLMSGVQFPGTR
jgi:hypothetical protein